MITVLCVGDVVGKSGRQVIKTRLQTLVNQYDVDFIVLNGENSAGGFGINKRTYDEFKSLGVDVLTSGNHIYDKREIIQTFDDYEDLIRPLNFPPGAPGHGYIVKETGFGNVAVVNLMGRVFMQGFDCPFQTIDKHLDDIKKEADMVIVDFHTEATSEITAMGFHLAGKVSAVFGTHTHVQTADTRILEGHTAFMCDLGMCGAENGILGMKKDPIIRQFITGLPSRKEPETKAPFILNALLLSIDPETGQTHQAKPLYERYFEL